MPIAQKLDGKVFGRLTVLKEVGRVNKYTRMLRCRCECGNVVIRRYGNLTSGNTLSCGCLRQETSRIPRNVTHGASYTPEYNLYRSILGRCLYKGAGNYKYYGGRGIKVCKRWLGPKGFEKFYADMGPRPTKAHSIERKRVDGNYTPTNCYWATPVEQVRNRRNTVRVLYKGELVPLGYACNAASMPYDVVLARVKRGWSVERALSESVWLGGRRKKGSG